MNDKLIKQVNDKLAAMIPFNREGDRSEDFETWVLLHTCKEEIIRLTTELKESQALCLRFAQDRETQDAENESLRNQNTALDAKLAEYSERKYVPMTDVEWDGISKKWQSDSVECMKKCQSIPPFHLYIEAVVIRRAGLEMEK